MRKSAKSASIGGVLAGLFILSVSLGVAGCNVGMAPEGASGKQLQANFDKLSPEKKIQLIQNGPGTAAQKQAQIDKIKASEGQSNSK